MDMEAILHFLDVDQTTALNVSTLSGVQEQDTSVSRAPFYVQRHRCPDKCKCASEPHTVLRLLKHWKKTYHQKMACFSKSKETIK